MCWYCCSTGKLQHDCSVLRVIRDSRSVAAGKGPWGGGVGGGTGRHDISQRSVSAVTSMCRRNSTSNSSSNSSGNRTNKLQPQQAHCTLTIMACVLRPPRFNAVRTRKPQTFKVDAGAGIVDPTDGGKRCDFCNWRMLTAEVRLCAERGWGSGTNGALSPREACVHTAIREAGVVIGG